MGKPEPSFSVARSLLTLCTGAVGWVVAGEHLLANPTGSWKGRVLSHARPWLLAQYAGQREWFFDHWGRLLLAAAAGLLALIPLRGAIHWWHNTVLAKLTGTRFDPPDHAVPKVNFDLIEQIARTPEGYYFLGLDRRGKPVTVPESVLNTHLHALGPTGTGKTESCLFPLLLQDARRGKGGVFVDAKGAYSNIVRVKAIAALARRHRDVRIFSLEYPDACNSYNPVFMTPGADPLCTAERVFSDFRMDNEYYRGQSKLFFYNLVRLMAATGKPFSLVDVRLAVADDEALDYVMGLSDDKRARHDVNKQLAQLGKRRGETFTGLYNALAEFDPGGAVSEALNSYNPDIVIEDVINQRQIVYFHLPTNRYQLLGPAVGKIALRHLASVGSARDTRPDEYDRTPFSVNVDECQNFLCDSLLSSLATLRSARMQFRLAHQTPAQLEAVSKSYERDIRTNTRIKALFYSDDPDYLDLVARSYGTTTTYKKTVRFGWGPLWTHINSGEASNREVQEFRVHPDALKALAECGQAFLLMPHRAEPISMAMLPQLDVPDFALPRKPPAEGLNLYGKFVEPHVESMDHPNAGPVRAPRRTKRKAVAPKRRPARASSPNTGG